MAHDLLYLFRMVIFHSYVSLPEGMDDEQMDREKYKFMQISCGLGFQWGSINVKNSKLSMSLSDEDMCHFSTPNAQCRLKLHSKKTIEGTLYCIPIGAPSILISMKQMYASQTLHTTHCQVISKILFYSWHFSIFRPCRHQNIIETLRFTTTIEVTDLQPRYLYELDVEADAQAVMGQSWSYL